MKKQTLKLCLLTAVTILFGTQADAQQWLSAFSTPTNPTPNQIITDPGTTEVIIDNGAQFGFHTTSPMAHEFLLNCDINFEMIPMMSPPRRVIRGSAFESLDIFGSTGQASGGTIRLFSNGNGPKPGSVEISSAGTGNIDFVTNGGTEQLHVTNSGELNFEPSSNIRSIRAESGDGIEIYGGHNMPDGSGIHLASDARSAGSGAVTIMSGGAASTSTSNEPAFSFLQYANGAYSPSMYINKNGKVGVGTNNPAYKMTVNGEIGFEHGGFGHNIFGNSTEGIGIYANNGTSATPSNSGASMFLISDQNTQTSDVDKGQVRFISGGNSSSASQTAFDILQNSNNSFIPLLGILKNGYLGLNLYDKTDYKERLTIDGNIAFKPTNAAIIRSIRGYAPSGYLEMYAGENGNSGPGLFMYGNNWSSTQYGKPGEVDIWSTGGNSYGNHDPAFMLTHYNSNQTSQVWTNLLRLDKNGAVGIGTDPSTDANAENRLSLKGNIIMKSPWLPSYPNAVRGIHADNASSILGLYGGTNEFDGSFIQLFGHSHSVTSGPQDWGKISFVANADQSADQNDQAFSFGTFDGGQNWATHVVIRKDGKMIVGSDNIYNYYNAAQYARIPNGYKLYVEDGILTEKVKVAVKTTGDWSDFVFAKNYKLKSLSEVETFVNENKHLPDVPSAQDVMTDGIDLGKMDAKLLQKIEELTLYMIQQQKEIDALKKQLKK